MSFITIVMNGSRIWYTDFIRLFQISSFILGDRIVLDFAAENDVVGFCTTIGIDCYNTFDPGCRFFAMEGWGTERTLPE